MVDRVLSFLYIVVSVVAFVCASQVAFARLGENEQELEKRFGTPFHQEQVEGRGVAGEKILHYSKDGIVIKAVFWKGQSAMERYQFKKDIEDDTMATVEAIVDANANGRHWGKNANPQTANPAIKHYWETGDGSMSAVIWKQEPRTLEVIDQAFVHEMNRSRKAAESGASGF